MAIVNIRELMSRGIGSVSTKVRNIGRGISETESRFRGGLNNMIGTNISRRNLAIGTTGVGATIGGAILLTRYSGWQQDNDQGTGIVGNNQDVQRFGSLLANIGYNRIPGLKSNK